MTTLITLLVIEAIVSIAIFTYYYFEVQRLNKQCLKLLEFSKNQNEQWYRQVEQVINSYSEDAFKDLEKIQILENQISKYSKIARTLKEDRDNLKMEILNLQEQLNKGKLKEKRGRK